MPPAVASDRNVHAPPDPAGPDPIVIIGAARSGTRILRDVLAAAPGTRAVPYDVNYVWRYCAAEPDDVLDPAGLSPARRGFIRQTLNNLAGIQSGDTTTRLIEKSVSSGLRIPFVDAVLPNAHFVHLIRDGRDVAESAMRSWRAPPDWRALMTKLRGIPLANLDYAAWFVWNTLRGLIAGRRGGKVWGPRYPGIDVDAGRLSLASVCARQWLESVSRARAGLDRLPPARRTEVRYEDFVRGPDAVERLLTATGLDRDPTDAAAIRDAWAAKVRSDTNGRWRTLPESDRASIIQVAGPLLVDLGYMEKEDA